MRLVFVGGIHGAGKTTLARALSLSLDATHYSAGQLLTRRYPDSHGSRKSVTDVEFNQAEILEWLRGVDPSTDVLFLDGHFSLLGPDREIIDVPIEAFESLSPQVLFFVDTSLKEIQARLRIRDDEVYSLELLEDLRSASLRHAKEVSKATGAPLKILPSGTPMEEVTRLIR